MANYLITMQHSEDTFKRLSRKQYDLFCGSNRVIRTVITIVCIAVGLNSYEQWWGVALIAYGCYMFTSTYAQADLTAKQLAKQVRDSGRSFPSSRYEFKKNYMEITILPVREDEEPELLKYRNMAGISEDREYFYLFRDQYSGYMVPKEQLGARVDDFRRFIEKATDKQFYSVPLTRLLRFINKH